MVHSSERWGGWYHVGSCLNNYHTNSMAMVCDDENQIITHWLTHLCEFFLSCLSTSLGHTARKI